jgi:hypothetical protein
MSLPAAPGEASSNSVDVSRLQLLMGRNLMAYQELEFLMKELACIVQVSAPLKDIEKVMKARRERIQKLTLGGTVEDVMSMFDQGDEPDDADTSSGIHFQAKLTIQASALDKEAERHRIAAVVAERNWLVHACLRELCFSSNQEVREEAEARIERQHAAANEMLTQVRERLRKFIELRKEAGEVFKKITIPAMIFQNQAQALLAEPRVLRPEADGAFLVQRLVDMIRGRGRLSTENFKDLRGFGIEALLLEVDPRLKFEDRIMGEQPVRFGILPLG